MKSQIEDILNLPLETLDKMSDEELEKLLAPLIPAARVVEKTYAADASRDMIEKLSKVFGV